MSDGVDSLANPNEPAYLRNILESHPEETYTGQNFAGGLNSDPIQNIDNQNAPQTFDMFGGIQQVEMLGTNQTLPIESSPRNTIGG